MTTSTFWALVSGYAIDAVWTMKLHFATFGCYLSCIFHVMYLSHTLFNRGPERRHIQQGPLNNKKQGHDPWCSTREGSLVWSASCTHTKALGTMLHRRFGTSTACNRSFTLSYTMPDKSNKVKSYTFVSIKDFRLIYWFSVHKSWDKQNICCYLSTWPHRSYSYIHCRAPIPCCSTGRL